MRRFFAVALCVLLVGTAVGTAAPPSASFHNNVQTIENGETVTIVVSLQNATTANFSLGDSTTDYAVNAAIHDEDENGEIRLEFDTDAAGDGASVLTANGADTVAVTAEHGTGNETLTTGSYQLYVGFDEWTDLGLLTVQSDTGTDGTTAGPTTADELTSTAQATDEPMTTATSGLSSTSTEESIPGFGVTVALAGVLGAAVLAIRR